jgi:hypothetical protein
MTNIIYEVYNFVTEINKSLKTAIKTIPYIVNHLKNALFNHKSGHYLQPLCNIIVYW